MNEKLEEWSLFTYQIDHGNLLYQSFDTRFLRF
jgi:hypothetical protein